MGLPELIARERTLLGNTRVMSKLLLARSRKIRSADRAWLALALGVAVYELAAPEGEMMSHSFDRWLQVHPVMTWGATLVTVAHLLNLLPDWADPFVLGVRRG